MKTAAQGMLVFVLAGLVVALLALWPATVNAAAYVYQDSNIQVILRDTPCKDAAILSVIEEPFRPQFRTADIVWQGKPLKGCWAAFPDRGQALIVDETGDYGPLPLGAFKPLTDI